MEVDKQKVVCVGASFYPRCENILSNKYTNTHLSQTSSDDICPPSKSLDLYFQGTVVENSCAQWSLIKVIKIANKHEWRCHLPEYLILKTIVRIFLRLHQKTRKGSRLLSKCPSIQQPLLCPQSGFFLDISPFLCVGTNVKIYLSHFFSFQLFTQFSGFAFSFFANSFQIPLLIKYTPLSVKICFQLWKF